MRGPKVGKTAGRSSLLLACLVVPKLLLSRGRAGGERAERRARGRRAGAKGRHEAHEAKDEGKNDAGSHRVARKLRCRRGSAVKRR